ncbi:MAG: hypothetical protein GVY23_06450, partial [Spirochaetes bacterium]|nr:hypothetical protein [Spirochaetota bacterium]
QKRRRDRGERQACKAEHGEERGKQPSETSKRYSQRTYGSIAVDQSREKECQHGGNGKDELTHAATIHHCLGRCRRPWDGDNDTAETRDLSGRYVGYSWGSEASGVSFDDASRYIQTILELDEDGTILEATMWFWVQKDGYWTTRQSGNAFVEVDFSVDPELPSLGLIMSRALRCSPSTRRI